MSENDFKNWWSNNEKLLYSGVETNQRIAISHSKIHLVLLIATTQKCSLFTGLLIYRPAGTVLCLAEWV